MEVVQIAEEEVGKLLEVAVAVFRVAVEVCNLIEEKGYLEIE